MSNWRPIQTAPRNGKWVLLWWPDVTDAAFVGYTVCGHWHAATGGDTWSGSEPTHWMPLPEGPSQETRSDALEIPDFLRNQENLRTERAACTCEMDRDMCLIHS